MRPDDLERRLREGLRARANTFVLAHPDEPPRAFPSERDGQQRRHPRWSSPRPSVIHRVAIAGIAVVAVGGVVGGLVASTTPGPGSGRTATPQHAGPTPPASKAPTSPPYVVAGYTTAQAATATEKCLAAAPSPGPEGDPGSGAALRATFTDSLGSLLVVTTSNGFYTCDQAPDGTLTTDQAFVSYEAIDGSPPPLPGSPVQPVPIPGDPGAHWLLSPAELDSSGGGYPSKSQTNIWVTTAIGRVAPDVTKVVLQLPGEPTVTATVENGFFVARQVSAGPPATPEQVVTIPILAYDASGTLVYDSLTAPTAIRPGTAGSGPLPTPPCFVTPSGQPVTHKSTPDQHCETAVAWGY